MNFLRRPSWSPYATGAILGMVSLFAVLTSGKFLGASTSFARTTGMLVKILSPDYVLSLPYFNKEKPIIDWQWMMVIGILFGALLAAGISEQIKPKFVPSMWEKRFGPSRFKRWGWSFMGGILIMFGARMADG
jgi:uncharacterized protein